jgi:hypothetical protein
MSSLATLRSRRRRLSTSFPGSESPRRKRTRVRSPRRSQKRYASISYRSPPPRWLPKPPQKQRRKRKRPQQRLPGKRRRFRPQHRQWLPNRLCPPRRLLRRQPRLRPRRFHSLPPQQSNQRHLQHPRQALPRLRQPGFHRLPRRRANSPWPCGQQHRCRQATVRRSPHRLPARVRERRLGDASAGRAAESPLGSARPFRVLAHHQASR